MDTDVLVIGGGITAAFAAIKAREAGAKVILVDKASFGRSGCSALASGSFSTFFPGDDMEAWLKRASGGPTTRIFVDQDLLKKAFLLTHECVQLMEKWGVRWIKDGGTLVRAGGSVTAGADNVLMDGGGPMLMMAIRGEVLRRGGIQIINRVMINNLLTSDGQLPTQGDVIGAIGVNTRSGDVYVFKARKVIMASGPFMLPYPRLDKPYRGHGMPRNHSGDGHAAMLRAGAIMGKLELGGLSICPWHSFSAPGLELSFGLGGTGIFVNGKGERFLQGKDMHKRDLGRSTISVAIARELKEGRGPVCVDVSQLTAEQRRLLKQVVPIVYGNWEAVGFDPAKDPIPYSSIFMASHSVAGGGVHINPQMETSLPHLYAAGNCSDGAYMSMGQNLPQCTAMGYWAGENAGKTYRDVSDPNLVEDQVQELTQNLLAPITQKQGLSYEQVHVKMEDIYSNYIGRTFRGDKGEEALAIVRSVIQNDLPQLMADEPRQLGKVLGLKNFMEFLEPVLMVLLHRKESRGNVIRNDYPYTDNENWLKRTFSRKDSNGQINLWDESLPEERTKGITRKKELHPFFAEEVA